MDPFTAAAVTVSFVVLTTASTAMATFEKIKYEKAKQNALAAKHMEIEQNEDGDTPIVKVVRSKSVDYSNSQFNKYLMKKSNEEIKKAKKEAKKSLKENEDLKKLLQHSMEESKKLKSELDSSKEQTKELKSQIEVTKKEVLKAKKSFDGSKIVSLNANEDSNKESPNLAVKSKFLSPSKFSVHLKNTNKQKLKAKLDEKAKIEKIKIELHSDGEDDAIGAFSALSSIEHVKFDLIPALGEASFDVSAQA